MVAMAKGRRVRMCVLCLSVCLSVYTWKVAWTCRDCGDWNYSVWTVSLVFVCVLCVSCFSLSLTLYLVSHFHAVSCLPFCLAAHLSLFVVSVLLPAPPLSPSARAAGWGPLFCDGGSGYW